MYHPIPPLMGPEVFAGLEGEARDEKAGEQVYQTETTVPA